MGRGRSGRDEGGAGSGPLTAGKEMGGAAEGLPRAAASLRGKLHAALVGEMVGGGGRGEGGGAAAAAAETTLPPPPHPREKGERGSLPHLLSLCVPSAFSPPVCSFPPRLPPSPSAATQHWKN